METKLIVGLFVSIPFMILFLLILDEKTLTLFQSLSDFITKRTGKDNFQVATLIALGSNAIFFLQFGLYSINRWGKTENIVLAIIAGFLTLILLFHLWLIRLGKKNYRIDDESVKINYRTQCTLEELRYYAFYSMIFYGTTFFTTGHVSRWLTALLCGATLMIMYFISCIPLPGRKVKISVWLWGKVKAIAKTFSPAPKPVSVPV